MQKELPDWLRQDGPETDQERKARELVDELKAEAKKLNARLLREVESKRITQLETALRGLVEAYDVRVSDRGMAFYNHSPRLSRGAWKAAVEALDATR